MNNEEKLKEAKRLYQTANFDQRYVLESLFPELKESEDERIRKELITHCRNTRCVTEEGAERIAKWIAWLEKQGEKKPFDYEKANIQQKDFALKVAIASRQLYNRAILKLLSNYVEKYPDIRFGQMLCNLGFGHVFNEESQEIYLKLNETINKQKS